MSLPPGFLDELRTRISLSQVVGRKVMWDPRKSNQGKGDMWAPCPFHQEKSASFHVDDRKGFYYCFGCHAKGDAISFVKETENVDFMEAVKILATEAGMPMPAADPQAAKKADRRTQLAEVMDATVQFYRLQLQTSAASEARAYLTRRGLSAQTQERFDIGFAPDARQALFAHLTAKGMAPELILASGMCAKPDDGGAPYDRFRGRIIFPIRDARGRAISLGGRSLDPNARAKYLNGPETDLFDKGRNLYNHGPAREAAGKGAPLIVAEGYMDVIALAMAGFGAAVAPLGTAVTEDQLRLMWRISPEPIIALDGDAAGVRAALRVIDLALPLLEAGQSLRFAVLPQGQDPDDLIKAKGPAAMQAVLDAAKPMVSLLWDRETEGRSFDSPERRATLDKALREKIKLIRDPSIRTHYGEVIKEMRWELFKGSRAKQPAKRAPYVRGGKSGAPWANTEPPRASTKSSALAMGDASDMERLREAVILATLIATPEVLPEFEAQLERFICSERDHDKMRVDLLHLACLDPGDGYDQHLQSLRANALETLLQVPHVRLCPAVRLAGDAEQARMTLNEELAKLQSHRGVAAEVDEASDALLGLADEALTWRLQQAAEARNKAERSENEDRAEYDTGPNGARINRDERNALDALLGRIEGATQKK